MGRQFGIIAAPALLAAVALAAPAAAGIDTPPGGAAGGAAPTLNNVILPDALGNLNGNATSHTYYANTYKGAVSGVACTWNAASDVGDCINAAIADAIAKGGGTVMIPAGTFGQTVTVSQTNKNNVTIAGAGGPGFSGVCSTTLKWLGAAGGTQVQIGPSADAVLGGGMRGLCIDGNNAGAAIGIRLRGVAYAVFSDVHVKEVSATAWDLDANDVASGGLHDNYFVNTGVALSGAGSASAKGWKLGQSATVTGNDTYSSYWIGGRIQHQNGTGFECGAADSIQAYGLDIQPVGGGTGKSLHLLGHPSNALLACRANRFITSGGFGRAAATRPVADTDVNPSLRNYIWQNHESQSGDITPQVNGSATLTWDSDRGNYYNNAGTSVTFAAGSSFAFGGMAYTAAGTNNAVFDIDTANSSNFATGAKFGPDKPVYLLYNNPIIGFNSYWQSASFRFGKGSTAHYAGNLSFAAASGTYTWSVSNAAGAAGAAATLVNLKQLDRNGHEWVGGQAAPTLTTCGTTPAISGTDRAGEVTMGTGTPTGCTITFAVAYAAVPYCTVTWRANLASMQYTVTTTAITLTQTATSSNKVDYRCLARSGG